jgi:transposase-like protein
MACLEGIMNCDELSFSQRLCDSRLAQAEAVLGAAETRKLLAYALFLAGAPRSSVASALDMPPGTLRSLVRTIHMRGLSGLEDQRARTSSFKPPAPEQPAPTVQQRPGTSVVDFGVGGLELRIPDANSAQKRVVLLSLLNSGILTRSQVAEALGLSAEHVGKLARKLVEDDVAGVLDQRQGQQQDYRFTPDVKAELIQQYVLDIVARGHTSGQQLAANLEERCALVLSPRSILHHLSALGLPQIKQSLPELLENVKKNS